MWIENTKLKNRFEADRINEINRNQRPCRVDSISLLHNSPTSGPFLISAVGSHLKLWATQIIRWSRCRANEAQNQWSINWNWNELDEYNRRCCHCRTCTSRPVGNWYLSTSQIFRKQNAEEAVVSGCSRRRAGTSLLS